MRYEILQGFLVERMGPLVFWVSFSKDFLSVCVCFGEALEYSLEQQSPTFQTCNRWLEGKLTPFELLGSLWGGGLLHFKVNFFPSKSLCLERVFEVFPLLSQGESWDRLDILAAGRTA